MLIAIIRRAKYVPVIGVDEVSVPPLTRHTSKQVVNVSIDIDGNGVGSTCLKKPLHACTSSYFNVALTNWFRPIRYSKHEMHKSKPKAFCDPDIQYPIMLGGESLWHWIIGVTGELVFIQFWLATRKSSTATVPTEMGEPKHLSVLKYAQNQFSDKPVW